MHVASRRKAPAFRLKPTREDLLNIILELAGDCNRLTITDLLPPNS